MADGDIAWDEAARGARARWPRRAGAAEAMTSDAATPIERAACVRLATEADRPAWDALIAARPEADPLQAWAWGEVTGRHGERPLRLVLRRPDDGARRASPRCCCARRPAAGRSATCRTDRSGAAIDRPTCRPAGRDPRRRTCASAPSWSRSIRAPIAETTPRSSTWPTPRGCGPAAGSVRPPGADHPHRRPDRRPGGDLGPLGAGCPDARAPSGQGGRRHVGRSDRRTVGRRASLAALHAGTAERADFRARSAILPGRRRGGLRAALAAGWRSRRAWTASRSRPWASCASAIARRTCGVVRRAMPAAERYARPVRRAGGGHGGAGRRWRDDPRPVGRGRGRRGGRRIPRPPATAASSASSAAGRSATRAPSTSSSTRSGTACATPRATARSLIRARRADLRAHRHAPRTIVHGPALHLPLR